jgi:hypothetical protein
MEACTEIYTICVSGWLDAGWSAWFPGLDVVTLPSQPPATILTGPVTDQAALRGILNKLWDLNLKILSVQKHEKTEAQS